jgi:predicted dehydrogenase
LAARFADPPVFDSAEELMRSASPTVIDIITNEDSHTHYALMAAAHGLPAIVQKPMAPSYAECVRMVDGCEEAGVPLFVHDNWRWQYPIRRVKDELDSGVIGDPFRCRITYCNSYPVFENQPFLAEVERFMLMDMGTHLLDTARGLLGNAAGVYCRTTRVNPDIKGEDVATVCLQMASGAACTVEMSYASQVEDDLFPQTFLFIEATNGSLELGPDYRISRTSGGVTTSYRHRPVVRPWVHADYVLAASSAEPANRDFAAALRGEKEAETTGRSYLETMELVFAGYESAEANAFISLDEFRRRNR